MKHFEETIILSHGMLHLLYIHIILKLPIINENLDCYQSEAKGRKFCPEKWMPGINTFQ